MTTNLRVGRSNLFVDLFDQLLLCWSRRAAPIRSPSGVSPIWPTISLTSTMRSIRSLATIYFELWRFSLNIQSIQNKAEVTHNIVDLEVIKINIARMRSFRFCVQSEASYIVLRCQVGLI